MTYSRWWPRAGFVVVLALAWCAYAPGLSGDFLFDDFVNLDSLSVPGPVDNAPAFWRYITSGIADPIGRPLSLLSFLIDANHWPAEPAPFLRTNVLLHLLNGTLLFISLRGLGDALGDTPGRRDGAALIGAGLWLLHPLFVSTTLYVVQREAMLPATFTLLALIAYVRGRMQLATAPRAGLAWMLAAIAFGTLLATASKANGLLLPLLAWVIEAMVLRPRLAARVPRWFALVGLVLPSLVVLVYLLAQLRYLTAPIVHRPWTLAERLLTEPRVLLDYLHLLAAPRVSSTGVYNDGYLVSRGLFAPPSTLFALLVIPALGAGAFLARKRYPAMSTALLFFFAGHVLESTTIALELYFEHRNYLPAMLLAWPLGRAIAGWNVPVRARIAVTVMLFAFFTFTTWQRADLWGTPQRMTLLWAAQNPASSRAQATAALYEIRAGDPASARARLEPLRRARPDDLQLVLNYASAACETGGLSKADVAAVGFALANAREGDQMIFRWLSRALDLAEGRHCNGLDIDAVAGWTAAAWRNPRMGRVGGRRQELHSLEGRIALERGDSDGALRAFDRALDAEWSPDAAGMQASWLAMAGKYRHALAHLDHYDALRERQPAPHGWSMRRVHAWVLERQGYWPHEMSALRRKLREEIAREDAARG
jgi:protein O-mannosyl-transferase